MLGWEFYIFKIDDPNKPTAIPSNTKSLVSWRSGLGGTQWIDDLVISNIASDLGGNGYPYRYSIKAGDLNQVLENGLPKHKGPTVFGDDYLARGGWTENLNIDINHLQEMAPDETLMIEAWDQS